jgi:voltage-gated potassium channel
MTTQTTLKQWQRRTEWPLAALALVFLGLYFVQVLTQPHGYESRVLWTVTWAIWGLFILDYIARLYLAHRRFYRVRSDPSDLRSGAGGI